MAVVNFESREILAKAVFFGIKGAGKTSNFREIYKQLSPEIKSGQFELSELKNPSPFEFLPVSLGYVRDFHLKFHLYSFPANYSTWALSSVMLTGIDGLVFVYDSQISKTEENLGLWEEMENKLKNLAISSTSIAKIIQFNKQDHNDAIPLNILREELIKIGYTQCSSNASSGKGTLETLKILAEDVLSRVATATH